MKIWVFPATEEVGMKRKEWFVKLSGMLLAGALLMPSTASAVDLKIGALPIGTSWYVFGATLAKLLEPVLPPGSNVEVVAKGGGVGNPIAVEQGKEQLALSNVCTSVWAMEGDKDIYKGVQHKNIRSLVGGLNPVWVFAMMREDYMKKSGNDTLEKALLSKTHAPRIVMKPAGSSVPPIVDLLFSALGTSRDQIKANGGEIIQVGADQIPGMIRDGRADLYFEGAPQGHPAVTEVGLTGNVKFVDFPEKGLKALAAKGLNPLPMPVFYKGQEKPTKAVDMGTHLIARADVPDDIAYVVTKTLIEKKADMAAAHKAWADFTPEDAWKPENNGIPLHPGAIKYYKERGWMK